MSADIVASVISVVAALLVGWAVPALAMRMLVPSLDASARKVRNYRGVDVPAGLGIAWAIWAVLLLIVMLKTSLISSFVPELDLSAWEWWAMPAVLVTLAFAFGLVDDAYGADDAKGFRGHLRAMRQGRLTTGGLKLVGIGLASVFAALYGASSRLSDPGGSAVGAAVGWVLGALVIALSANLVNLMDLRPGRALKSYVGLVVLALPGLIGMASAGSGLLAGLGLQGAPAARVAFIVVTLLLALGPVVAVWRYDLGERAMLGDAGANAMGALAGYLLAVSLPWWGLVIAAAALLALNLASERVSFTKVIEGSAVLTWLDGLGRLPADADAGYGTGLPGGGSAASSGDDVVEDTGKDGAS